MSIYFKFEINIAHPVLPVKHKGKGFLFFQKFLKEQGILKELEELGIQDGDTVRMYGLSFDYYK